jgi:hypothetical protein
MARIATSDELRVRCMAQVVKGQLAIPGSLAAPLELKLQGASALCRRTPRCAARGQVNAEVRTGL